VLPNKAIAPVSVDQVLSVLFFVERNQIAEKCETMHCDFTFYASQKGIPKDGMIPQHKNLFDCHCRPKNLRKN
jgi:hypothetical protein